MKKKHHNYIQDCVLQFKFFYENLCFSKKIDVFLHFSTSRAHLCVLFSNPNTK